uniref:Uncharacterized protein n=1 Tax=Glossina morsitans morsitans TaxID=37546 RepID=A0A1B0GEJ3_GLOMM
MSAVLILILIPSLIFGLKIRDKNDGRNFGAIVSNGYGCADIGREALYDGGTAVDAAIATLVCEGVVVAHSMGIGGGFVATIYKRFDAKVETVIARESAPAAAHKDMFIGETSVTGARAVAVPGEILGYWELHKRYGRLPWKSLFQPTIKLCKEGHFVSKYLAAALKKEEERLRAEPSMAEVFVKPDKSLYKEGDFLKRPTLAMTLERIADNGADEIYGGGETGKMLVKDIQNMGGIITEEDLKNYKVEWENEHVEAKITGGYKLYTTPLPSSGAVLAFILNVMNGLYTDNQDIYWHRVIETYKHAYGQRTNLGDLKNEPDDPKMIKDTFENLISAQFAQKIRELIRDNETFTDMLYYGANFTNEEDSGTANMAVLAPNGDAITVTSTINNYFGAKVRSSSTGIILNDEMDDFSTPGVVNSFGVPASPANYIHPGKRPLSSMCPSIILDGDGNVRLLVGAAGGTKITTAVAQTIIKYLILNESLHQAVNDGRLHHQLAPMKVIIESKVPDKIVKYLKSVGHEVETSPEGTGFAALTAIGMRSSIPEPYYDSRRVGSTAVLKKKRGTVSLQKMPNFVGAIVSNGLGCADIGHEMLCDGGTAIDAAIATLLCEGVIVPHGMGIGGGFLATVYTRIETVIAREWAPAAAHKNMFTGRSSVVGARAVAVPGEMLGYWELHQHYGSLPWKSLFQPTIKLCKEGHIVSKFLAAVIKSKEKEIRNEPSLAELFVKSDNSLCKEGDFLARPTLAMTLERIADNGADEIYGGGKRLIKDIQNMGGLITERDLMNYKVQFAKNYVEADIIGGYKLYTTPLPSSGAVLVFILNVMSGLYTDNQDIYWHRVVEAYKHAYGQRTNLGDLNNETDDAKMIKNTFENLISVQFAEKIRSLIHDNVTYSNMLYYGANFSTKEDHGTTNLAVLAPNGDAITITSTINNYFGAKIISPSTGIILNNEMDDFSTPGAVNSYGVLSSPANYIYPGKRPMSLTCPSIILDGEGNVRLLVGAAGGAKITTAVAQTIIKYLIFNEPLDRAVNDGRLHHQLSPMKVLVEANVPKSIVKYLKEIGHEIEMLCENSEFSTLTAIGMRSGCVPEPHCDNRRTDGSAILIKQREK